jgi:cytochrome c biogenesis protein CcmG/thiol:disulfide interchange protein DsbE
MRTIVALGAVLLGAACSRGADKEGKPDAAEKVEIGAPAPTYATLALSGDSVSLASLRGKVVLLNIWATWCHPCRTEIPELRALHAKYKDRGLELVGVSVDADGTDDAIKGFMEEFRMTYPVWRDPDERVSTKFLTIGVPATYLIDRDGILRWRMTGPIAPNDSTLAAAIKRALGT